jgi:carboxymethylenebutenolidase
MEAKLIEFDRPDGKKVPGYLAVPADGKHHGAVVVIQEWWGLNPQIKSVADRLAKAGFRALVPDLFRGKRATNEDEAKHLMAGLDWADATSQDVRGAIQHVKSWDQTKAAVLGFCMGGAVTLMAGVKVPEADAGVCFYGIPPAQAADPSAIRVPMQFHFAKRDDWCSPPVVAKLEEALKRGKVSYELFSYDADHAFMNDARPEVYAPNEAKVAWDRALQFLKQKLS